MIVFIKGNSGNLSRCNSVSVKLDSKGRISIPGFLRKNLGLVEGIKLELVFDLKECFFIVQNSVKDSTEVCGSTSFFRKERPTLERNYNTKQITSSPSSNLGSGPLKTKRREYYDR